MSELDKDCKTELDRLVQEATLQSNMKFKVDEINITPPPRSLFQRVLDRLSERELPGIRYKVFCDDKEVITGASYIETSFYLWGVLDGIKIEGTNVVNVYYQK